MSPGNGRRRPPQAAPQTSASPGTRSTTNLAAPRREYPPDTVANHRAFNDFASMVWDTLPESARARPWEAHPLAQFVLEHRTGRMLVVHVAVAPEFYGEQADL